MSGWGLGFAAGQGAAPGGGGISAIEYASTTAPVVSATSAQDLLPTVGVQTTCTFSSTQPGFWGVASNVPGATITQASDGLSATITWTPQAYPVCSIYIAARCKNSAGSSIATIRSHPGMRGVIRVGATGDYANLHAAFAAVRGFADPGGYAFVIEDGTYTASNMFIYYDDMGTGPQPYMPPCGEYTQSGSAPDVQYTVTRFTSVMAETPFGVVLDGQGTRELAVELYGNTPFETDQAAVFPTSQHLVSANTDMRGIHIAGIVSDDTDNSGFKSYYCDHIFFEYLLCGEVSRLSENQNNSAIQFQDSKDCVKENCFSFGPARYNFSDYQSHRVVGRRLFGRKDVVKTQEPHGGIVQYRVRDCLIDNALHFDADNLEEFDTTIGMSPPSQDVGFLGIAATGVTGYPRNITFRRCLMLNSRMGFSENDAYDVTSTYFDDFVWNDTGAWYYKPNSIWGGGAGISAGGPSTFNYFTSVYLDNVDSAYTANAFRKLININDSVLYNMGHSYDGAGRGVQTFAYASGTDNYVHLTDCTNYGASFATEIAGNPGDFVKTNVDTTTDPTTQGVRYPGRLEPGSNYKTSHCGQDNFYFACGPRGYNFGQTDYDAETNQNWLEEAMFELAMPYYRAYSYTGATNTLGEQTLSGDRGAAQAGKLPIDYTASTMGRDVPFLVTTSIAKVGAYVRVAQRLPEADYATNITAVRVYQNGALIHTADPTTHAIDFTGLTVGASITQTLVDSVHGESGHSYALTVPA